MTAVDLTALTCARQADVIVESFAPLHRCDALWLEILLTHSRAIIFISALLISPRSLSTRLEFLSSDGIYILELAVLF